MTYAATFAVSFLLLLYERVWESFWAALSLFFLWLALALSGTAAAFGPGGGAALLCCFALGFSVLAARGARGFRFPDAGAVERRMEEDGRLRHRPLAALRDSPAGELEGDALRLWHKHIARMEALKAHIGPCRPRPDTARRDPWGLRHGALALLVMGLVIAGGRAEERLASAFRPAVTLPSFGPREAVDVWIVPPDYTHRAPVFLASASAGAVLTPGPVEVPAGSALKVRVTGHRRAPRLRYARAPRAFTRAEGRSWLLDLPLTESGPLRLRQGFRALGNWEIAVVPDAAPEISLVSTGETPRAALKISYKGSDDYGIARVTGRVAPAADGVSRVGDEVMTFDLPPPARGGAESAFTVDLTSNIRAGQKAELTLTAEDAAGNAATTEPFYFTLPERVFSNPLARRLIAARKALTPGAAGVPDTAKIAAEIADIAGRPALYNGDTTLFLALGSAARRLVRDKTPEGVRSVRDLLWDAALKLEDGGLTVAARELSLALQKLANAMGDQNLQKAEAQKLMDEVRQRMQDYMRALARELQQQMAAGKDMPSLPPDLAQKFMNRIDLDAMMRQLAQMSENNPREAMRRMAEMLKNTVDSFDPAQLQRMQKAQRQAIEALAALRDIVRGQQTLMDKTARLPPAAQAGKEAGEQGALRERLGGVMRNLAEVLPEIPSNFLKADQAMKRAQQALEGGRAKAAPPEQKTALEELQKGEDSAVDQMAQAMQQTMLSFGLMPGEGGFGEGFDPLGRETGQGKGGGDINIPDEKERRRVQEIIRELRSRSNDFTRPKVERDYLDRLLDQMN